MSADCFACSTTGLMRLDDALDRLDAALSPVAPVESASLVQSLGRFLAEDVVAPHNVPPHDNSAVDGWAVFTADLAEDGGTTLPIGGRIAAGHVLAGEAKRGFAYRIFTGAPVPPGPDAILMQEDCRQDGETVTLPARPKPGANLRKAGEDMRQGEVQLFKGSRVRPQELAVSAALGRMHLEVHAPVRVAVFSTGDELRDPGQPLEPGCIHDTNRYALRTFLIQMGCAVTDLGILKDDRAAIAAKLRQAAEWHDVILTSGGVSVGEEDHVKGAVEDAGGELHLWRLAIKPGKPLAMGRIGKAVFLGLPGNPVAVMATFALVARPVIERLGGALKFRRPQRFPVKAGFDLSRKGGRRDFARASLVSRGGELFAVPFRSESSGIITSMTRCDGFLDLPEEGVEVRQGDLVDFIPFAEALPA